MLTQLDRQRAIDFAMQREAERAWLQQAVGPEHTQAEAEDVLKRRIQLAQGDAALQTALEQAPKQQQTGHRCPAALAELHADVPIPSRKRAADGGQVGSRLETSPQRCGNHGKVATAMGGASPRQMVPTSTSEEGGAAGAEQLLDKTKVNDQAEVNEQTMDATLPWPDREKAGCPAARVRTAAGQAQATERGHRSGTERSDSGGTKATAESST